MLLVLVRNINQYQNVSPFYTPYTPVFLSSSQEHHEKKGCGTCMRKVIVYSSKFVLHALEAWINCKPDQLTTSNQNRLPVVTRNSQMFEHLAICRVQNSETMCNSLGINHGPKTMQDPGQSAIHQPGSIHVVKHF